MTLLTQLMPDHWRFISNWLDATEFFSLLCCGSKSLTSILERSPLAQLSWTFEHKYALSSFKHVFNSLKADTVAVSSKCQLSLGTSFSLVQAASRAAIRTLRLEPSILVGLDTLNWWSVHFEAPTVTSISSLEFRLWIPRGGNHFFPNTPPIYIPPTLETLNVTMEGSVFTVPILPKTLKTLTLTLSMYKLQAFEHKIAAAMAHLPLLETFHAKLSQLELNDRILFKVTLTPSIRDFSLIFQPLHTVTIIGTPTLRKLTAYLGHMDARFENMPQVTHFQVQCRAAELKRTLEGAAFVPEAPLTAHSFGSPQLVLEPSRHPSDVFPSLTHLTVFETDFTSVKPIRWPVTLTRLEILDCDIAVDYRSRHAGGTVKRFYYALLPPNLKHLLVSGHVPNANSRIHIDDIGNSQAPLSDSAIREIYGTKGGYDPNYGGSPQIRPPLFGMTPHESMNPFAVMADNRDRTAAHIDVTAMLHDERQRERWKDRSSKLCSFHFREETCGYKPLPCDATLETLILKGAYAVVYPHADIYLPRTLKHFEASFGASNPRLFPDDGCHFYHIADNFEIETVLFRFRNVKKLKIERNILSDPTFPESSHLDLNAATAKYFIDCMLKCGIDIEPKLRSGDWSLPDFRLRIHVPDSTLHLSAVARPFNNAIPSKYVARILESLPPIEIGEPTLPPFKPSSSMSSTTENAPKMVVDAASSSSPAESGQVRPNIGAYFKLAHFEYGFQYTLPTQKMVTLTLDTLSAPLAYTLSHALAKLESLVSLRVLRSSSRVGLHRSFIPPSLEELVWDAGPLVCPSHTPKRFKDFDEIFNFNPDRDAVFSRSLKRLVAPLEKSSNEPDLMRLFANFPNLEHLTLLPSPDVIFIDVDYSEHTPLEDYTFPLQVATIAKHSMLAQRIAASHSKLDFLARTTHSSSTNCPIKSTSSAVTYVLDNTAVDFGLSDPSLCPPSIEFTGRQWNKNDANEHDRGFIGLAEVAKFLYTHSSETSTLSFTSYSLPEFFDAWVVPKGIHTIDLVNTYKMVVEGKEAAKSELPSLAWYCPPSAFPGLRILHLPSTLTRLSLILHNHLDPEFWTELPPGLRVLHLFGVTTDENGGTALKPTITPKKPTALSQWDLPRELEDLFAPALLVTFSLRFIPITLWRIVLGEFYAPTIEFKGVSTTKSKFDMKEYFHTEHARESLLFFQVGAKVYIDRRPDEIPEPPTNTTKIKKRRRSRI